MRLSTQQYEPIIIGDKALGVNLGFDFCAEHEWGFKWASRYLGRPEKPTRDLMGVQARTTTKHDPEFSIELVDAEDGLWLLARPAFERQWWTLQGALAGDNKAPIDIGLMMKSSTSAPLRSAWDDNVGFCVVGRSEPARNAVRVAHDALIGKRCFIVQSGGMLGAGGLRLIDADLIPDEADQQLRDTDTSALNLEDAVAATGIRDRLKTAGRSFYALSPRWEDEAAGTFKFWLNPAEQDRNNYGWFTLQDLENWIAGRGPIPKKGKAA